MKAVLARGLENVVVAETVLSDVDGQRGRLTLRGHSVEELAPTTTFEEAVCLLWRGTLPSAQERAAARAALAAGRVRAYEQLNSLGEALLAPDAMDGLKAGLAHIQPVAEQEDWSLVGAAAVFASAWWRVRQGAAPVTPDPALTHTADYLRMLTDEEAPPERVRALEQYLVTVMDHGMNASTFTARVVASTAVDTASAVVAAVCALKGPLHGGAPGPVLDMLDAIGQPEKAEAWLRAELDAGHRVMGMGHRVYRVRDPRAAVLERVIGELEQAG